MIDKEPSDADKIMKSSQSQKQHANSQAEHIGPQLLLEAQRDEAHSVQQISTVGGLEPPD